MLLAEHPSLLNVQMPICTQRLTIALREPGMGHMIYECIVESLPVFQHYFAWARDVSSVADVEEMIRRGYSEGGFGKVLHAVVYHDEKIVAGICFFNIDWTAMSAEIGYWCRTGATRHGYMTEAVRAWTRYGFEEIGFRRLVIGCDDDNVKSWGVAERAGFTLEARELGLSAPVHGTERVMNRRYARSDSHGLTDDIVLWQTLGHKNSHMP